jgi:hypothetical protein
MGLGLEIIAAYMEIESELASLKMYLKNIYLNLLTK